MPYRKRRPDLRTGSYLRTRPIQNYQTTKRPGPKPRNSKLISRRTEFGVLLAYQFTRTPKRMTRGATIAWIWLAFAAFWRLRMA